MPYLVISFLDNALPRDVSDPFPYLHLPPLLLPFPTSIVYFHTEYFDRPSRLARLIFIGPRGGEQVQRKHFKKRNFPTPPPDRVTNAPTTSITGVKTRNNGCPVIILNFGVTFPKFRKFFDLSNVEYVSLSLAILRVE